MQPISAIIPVAQSVQIGSRVFPVWEARLSDLADLQTWLCSQWGDPLSEAQAQIAANPECDFRAILRDAHAKAEAGPPSESSDEGAALIGSKEGQAVLLAIALRRGSPGLEALEIASLLSEITPEQYSRLRKIFYGVAPLEAVERAISGPQPSPGPSRLTWGQAIDEVSRIYGWTYEQIANMTLTQFGNARRAGKPEEPLGIVPRPGQTLAEAAREQYYRYWGTYPPEAIQA